MRTLALAVGLVAAALFAPRIEPALATQPRIEANAGCKPSAPIELELLSSRVTHGVLELDYLVRPTIEGRDVYVHINGEPGSEVLHHSVADTSGIQRGEARYGSARVRLPQNYELHGTLVELHAGLTFDGSGDDGTHAAETQEFVRTLLLGGPREAAEIELVTSGDETSLDTPAARTEGR